MWVLTIIRSKWCQMCSVFFSMVKCLCKCLKKITPGYICCHKSRWPSQDFKINNISHIHVSYQCKKIIFLNSGERVPKRAHIAFWVELPFTDLQRILNPLRITQIFQRVISYFKIMLFSENITLVKVYSKWHSIYGTEFTCSLSFIAARCLEIMM